MAGIDPDCRSGLRAGDGNRPLCDTDPQGRVCKIDRKAGANIGNAIVAGRYGQDARGIVADVKIGLPLRKLDCPSFFADTRMALPGDRVTLVPLARAIMRGAEPSLL